MAWFMPEVRPKSSALMIRRQAMRVRDDRKGLREPKCWNGGQRGTRTPDILLVRQAL
jgi:hypothetical protein